MPIHCSVEIPIDKNFDVQGLNKRRLFYQTKSFWILRRLTGSIFTNLDMEYWVTHCGCEGYIYLNVQRRILKLMTFLMVVSLAVAVPVNMFEATSYEDWLERTTLNNKQTSSLRSWIHLSLVIFFSIIVIGQIVKIRQDARKAYKFYYRSSS